MRRKEYTTTSVPRPAFHFSAYQIRKLSEDIEVAYVTVQILRTRRTVPPTGMQEH